MKIDPITSAQQQLIAHPFDIYHDVFHHYKVWENSRKIIFFEKLTPNLQALDIACWWHDVFRGDADNGRLIQTLQDTSISDDILEKAVTIIDEHSFGQTQTHLES